MLGARLRTSHTRLVLAAWVGFGGVLKALSLSPGAAVFWSMWLGSSFGEPLVRCEADLTLPEKRCVG